MRFFIDFDLGDAIRGWVVPDNPLAISRVAVAVEGRRVAEIPATITDDAFVRGGLHSTGQCVFVVTEAELPGLTAAAQVEVFDADTNVLIHRRRSTALAIDLRFCLINTSIVPEVDLQNALFERFQRSYFGVEKLSDEIFASILSDGKIASLFLSGNIVVPRYEAQLTPDLMLTAILVQDPYVEMAYRMSWLKDRADDAVDPQRSWRLGPLAAAAAFSGDCDYTDPRSLRHFFRMLPEAAYHLLYNPLTRQLATRLPDDRLHPGNSIAAIEVLSRIGIIGHKSSYHAFVETLFDRLGITAPAPALPPPPPEILALAERLRAVKSVHEMIVFDIAMSDAIKDIVAKNWAQA